MHTIQITGKSGVGKTQLLLDMRAAHSPPDLYIVDPLGVGNQAWRQPSPSGVAAVAFDHACFLRDPAHQVAAAHKWCEQHDKDLLLVGESTAELAAAGIHLERHALEVLVERAGAILTLTLRNGSASISINPGRSGREQVVAAARRFLVLPN